MTLVPENGLRNKTLQYRYEVSGHSIYKLHVVVVVVVVVVFNYYYLFTHFMDYALWSVQK
jgi:hypothetical protein